MSTPAADGRNDDRAAQLRRQHQQRLNRFFLMFAVVEGIVLVALVIIIYVLELIDPDVGIWLLLAVAALGGAFLSATLLRSVRRNQRELEELVRS